MLHPFEEATDAKGTIIYLKLLKMTVEAYIVKSTSVKTRNFDVSYKIVFHDQLIPYLQGY